MAADFRLKGRAILAWVLLWLAGCGEQGTSVSAKPVGSSSSWFNWAVISDLHIIDGMYLNREKTPLDRESITHAWDRLMAVREVLSRQDLRIDLLGVAGDVMHNYPTTDERFYKDLTDVKPAIALAKEMLEGFPMPVHIALGNHDYDKYGFLSREFTHELFREMLSTAPYHAFDHRGFRFVFLNSMLQVEGEADDKEGGLGSEQTAWLRRQLEAGIPTFLIVHHALWQMKSDTGFVALLEQFKDTIRLVISGHLHRWFDWKDAFGPWAINIGSTRYDEDAYLILACNEDTGEFQILNLDRIHWMGFESDPY